ncbi:unnamed protein product [Linum trigynum]|uniref:Uncharacterized protein n=1 Tax=Linum trigynum TaxID=586398 RepID=A0AAV2FPR5_9ROSI
MAIEPQHMNGNKQYWYPPQTTFECIKNVQTKSSHNVYISKKSRADYSPTTTNHAKNSSPRNKRMGNIGPHRDKI